jgi:hypothetical protein
MNFPSTDDEAVASKTGRNQLEDGEFIKVSHMDEGERQHLGTVPAISGTNF